MLAIWRSIRVASDPYSCFNLAENEFVGIGRLQCKVTLPAIYESNHTRFYCHFHWPVIYTEDVDGLRCDYSVVANESHAVSPTPAYDGSHVMGIATYSNREGGGLLGYNVGVVDSNVRAMSRRGLPALSPSLFSPIAVDADPVEYRTCLRPTPGWIGEFSRSGLFPVRKEIKVLIVSSLIARMDFHDSKASSPFPSMRFADRVGRALAHGFSGSNYYKYHSSSFSFESFSFNASNLHVSRFGAICDTNQPEILLFCDFARRSVLHDYSTLGVDIDSLRSAFEHKDFVQTLERVGGYGEIGNECDAHDMTMPFGVGAGCDPRVRERAIQSARLLVSFFSRFDVIIYDAVGWHNTWDISILTNFMSLARSAKIIRYVTSGDALLPFFRFPSHAFLTDSFLNVRELWGSTVFGAFAGDVVVLPPFIDAFALCLYFERRCGQYDDRFDVDSRCRGNCNNTMLERTTGDLLCDELRRQANDRVAPLRCIENSRVREHQASHDIRSEKQDLSNETASPLVRVIFLGSLSTHTSVTAFLRLAAAVRTKLEHSSTCRSYTDINTHGANVSIAFSDIEFLVIGRGHLVAEVQSLRKRLNLDNCDADATDCHRQRGVVFRFIDNADAIARTLADISSDGTISMLVDPAPTASVNADGYPLAALFGIPIVTFRANAAAEWMIDGQAFYAREVTLASLASTALSLICSGFNTTTMPRDEDGLPSFSNPIAIPNPVSAAAARFFSVQETSSRVFLTMHALVEGSRGRGLITSSHPHNRCEINDDAKKRSNGFTNDSSHFNTTLSAFSKLLHGFDETALHKRWLQESPPVKVSQTEQFCRNLQLCVRQGRCKTDTIFNSDVLTNMSPKLPRAGRSSHDINETYASLKEANRVLCVVYTIGSRHGQLQGVVDTWGKRCDGFIAFSDTEDVALNAVKLDLGATYTIADSFNIENIAIDKELPNMGGESYENMWAKVRVIWSAVACRYFGKCGSDQRESEVKKEASFDWVLISGDDTYIAVENLRDYLSSAEISRASEYGKRPMYLGRPILASHHTAYNTGGAGYILNTAAVEILITGIHSGLCFPHERSSTEDIAVGLCLSRNDEVVPYDTRDEEGRERFHWYSPDKEFLADESIYRQHAPTAPRAGLECCSPSSISFHHLSPVENLLCTHFAWIEEESDGGEHSA